MKRSSIPKIKLGFIFFAIFPLALFSDVRSTSGLIKFDSNSDSSAEMQLNSTGLGIGVTPAANLHVSGNAVVTDSLLLGTSHSRPSTFHLQGSLGMNAEMVSSNTTLSGNSIILVDSSSGNISLSLPTENTLGRIYMIKKTKTANQVFVRGNYIDDSFGFTLAAGTREDATLVNSGSQAWHLLSTSGNGAQWTPEAISANLTVWYDAADSSTISAGSAGNVYQWRDKSGNDNHANQATASLQPTTGTRSINGANALDWSSNYLDLDTRFNYVDKMFFFVVLNDSFNDNQYFSDRSVNIQLRGDSDGKLRFAAAATPYATSVSSFSQSTGSAHLIGYSCDVKPGFMLDGQFESVGADRSDSNSKLMGRIGNRANPLNPHDGLIAEIICSDILDTDERQKVEAYLAWKWGIEANLDAAHPYKSTPVQD